MAGFALQVDDGPVFLALLDMAKFQTDRFVAPKPASEQDGQQGAIALALQLLRLRSIPEPLRLVLAFASFQVGP